MLFSALVAPIVYVPLDDRPVTRELPQMLGRIAGRPVVEPPRALLGNYLSPGQPDAIIAWLNAHAPSGARDAVISTDMLTYGGLVASRVPNVAYDGAFFRMRALAQFHAAHPDAHISAFATVMRLAPTGVPAIGPAASFFAAFPVWQYLQQYANLHDPPLPQEEGTAAHLRALIGEPVLQAYLDARARNVAVDRILVRDVAANIVERAVIGQDDAGAIGLHVKEVQTLQDDVVQSGAGERITVEPGADELGMALVARALARGVGWQPHVAVRYSMPDGADQRDPLEFAPFATTISDLIALCGGVVDDAAPDVVLYVRVPSTDAEHDDALLVAMQADVNAHHAVAFADLTFLEKTFDAQARFAQMLIDRGVAGRLDAYASWNTDANTVGTALAETIAAGVGRRARTYDALAHAEFTFDRILDDDVFHTRVRPDLNATLTANGVDDHTYLLPEVAEPIALRNSAQLHYAAFTLAPVIFPGYHLAAFSATLPWNRTFETGIDARLAPDVR